jgi:hypothetical protein
MSYKLEINTFYSSIKLKNILFLENKLLNIKMSTKQSRKRFSLDLKYKVIKLIDSKTPFPESVNQLKDKGITIKNNYKFNSQRSEIIKRFENSISTKVKLLKKCFYPKL